MFFDPDRRLTNVVTLEITDGLVQTVRSITIRNSFRYASTADWAALAKDLRPVYSAPTEQAARMALDGLRGLPDAIADVWPRAIVQTCVRRRRGEVGRALSGDPSGSGATPGPRSSPSFPTARRSAE